MSELHISDHAALRWLERVGAVDVPALKAGIAAQLERAAGAADEIGADEYLVAVDELTFVVRGGTVVTVLPGGSQVMRARALADRSRRR